MIVEIGTEDPTETHLTNEASFKGRIAQGTIVQGTHHQYGSSSKRRIVY